MKFQLDHDFHIHTQLSGCSNDPEQTPQRVLQYAKEYGLKTVVLTDHFWDELVPGNFGWPGYEHISKWLPLPQEEGISFYFGGECDMNMAATVGISRETAEKMDFIIIPTTHLHFPDRTIAAEEYDDADARARRYIERWEAVLNADLPFHKIGLAHMTCPLLSGGYDRIDFLIDILDSIPDDTFKSMFARTEKLGMGVEINVDTNPYTPDRLERILRVYRIAADCGCHFYCGTDAHHPRDFEYGHQNCLRMIDALDLQEEQKFNPFNR